MKYAIHSDCIGKPEKRIVAGKAPEMWCGDKRIFLGHNWINVESSVEDFFELLTVDGRAIAPSLSSTDKNDSTVEQLDVLLVDIDAGMTLFELFAHEFYNMYASGFYVTPSHTEQDHRFRIIHKLETPLTSVELIRQLYRGMQSKYAQADKACKDASRLFYGTPNCEIKELRNNVLPDIMVAEIIAAVRAKEEKERNAELMRLANAPPPRDMDDAMRQRVIDLLHDPKSFIPESPRWEQWTRIVWGLRKGGYTLEQARYASVGVIGEYEGYMNEIERVWKEYKESTNISMGTVVHHLKKMHGDDCLRANKYQDKFGFTTLSKKVRV